MPNIFGADIAGVIAGALGELVFSQTLVKSVTTRDPSDATKVIIVKTEHPHRGFIDNYRNENMRGTSVRITDHKIVILGATLPAGIVPEPGDSIIAEGKTFVIKTDGVMRDPAAATYECQCG